ncbi:MAG: cytochrome c [Xanthomonadaceae bacterium]|nr:cytochrome c [Xanthomonadaceae bacterium]MDE2084920.1 cytochrome c [Xanthomonadaceae bacterium]MDE2256776.1 cytochrome c [Xanthomonadaceae bacterium]
MKSAIIAVAVAAAGVVLPAAAQHKPEQVIHYRQAAMTMIGWNFGTLGAMIKGKTAWDAQEFALRADRIAALAPQVLEGFAKGSEKGATTDAKAAIWTHFDDFKSKSDALVTQSKALSEAAHTGGEAAMKDQFRKTAEACKACHEKYKAD